VNEIKQILKKIGPSLSSDIAGIIIQNQKIERNTALKRVNRSIKDPGIQSSLCIKFKNNSKFMYLTEQFDSKPYWKKLLYILKKEKNLFYYIIMAIRANGGIVSEGELRCYSASPDLMKGKTRYEDIKYNLLKAKIIELLEINGEIHYLINQNLSTGKVSSNDYQANKIVKEVLLEMLKRWSVINSFAYKKSIREIDNEVPFFHYYWHLHAMSYSFNAISNKDVFLTFDLIMNKKSLFDDDIHFFLSKVAAIRKFKTAPHFIPFLISNYFSKSTLMLLKKQKVIATTPRNLFGEEVAEMIKDLVESLSDISKTLKDNPQKLYNSIRKLNKATGSALNMKGKLFEYFIAHYVFTETSNAFEVGKIVKDPESHDKAEIDVISYVPKKSVAIYECKAYGNNMITYDNLNDWQKKRKRIKNWIKSQENLSAAEITYFYISLSGYTDSAIQFYENDHNTHLIDKESLHRMIVGTKDGELINTFKEFFE
jgi:hypothetical protein